MLIWILLFSIILATSIFLAFRSMKDYHERPANFKVPSSLFLIKNPELVTGQILNQLHSAASKNGVILSFEKLFKGQRQALVVFGPISLLQPFTDPLGLVELEEYNQKITGKVLAWEVTRKKSSHGEITGDIFSPIPIFNHNEEFWWQVVLQPVGNKFSVLIRAMLLGEDLPRLKLLQSDLQRIGNSIGLALFPQPYSTDQIIKFYQERASQKKELILTAEEVKVLI